MNKKSVAVGIYRDPAIRQLLKEDALTSSQLNKIIVEETLTSAGAAKGNVFVGTTPIMAYHRHVRPTTSATEHLLLCTKYHILLWLQTQKSL